jgi:hypothetical protein
MLSHQLVIFSVNCPDNIVAAARLILFESFDSFKVSSGG